MSVGQDKTLRTYDNTRAGNGGEFTPFYGAEDVDCGHTGKCIYFFKIRRWFWSRLNYLWDYRNNFWIFDCWFFLDYRLWFRLNKSFFCLALYRALLWYWGFSRRGDVVLC